LRAAASTPEALEPEALEPIAEQNLYWCSLATSFAGEAAEECAAEAPYLYACDAGSPHLSISHEAT
jgi:hypothetical protein